MLERVARSAIITHKDAKVAPSGAVRYLQIVVEAVSDAVLAEFAFLSNRVGVVEVSANGRSECSGPLGARLPAWCG